MPCEAYRDLLHAYLDGELDPAGGHEVERHLAGCPRCTRSCQQIKALSRSLRTLVPPLAPPAGLHDSIRAALHRVELPPAPPVPGAHLLFLTLVAAGAAVLAGAGVGIWSMVRPTPAPAERPIKEVAACHIRSLMGDHLLDVANGDPAALQRWFHQRLPFQPIIPVPPQGANFHLAGARLDFVDGQTAAALVYRLGPHVINLYSWPDTRGPNALPPGFVFYDSQGYNLAHWGKGGMIYWVVTDLRPKELLEFLHQMGQATPPHCHW
jgi:anti-sigma factor RsiW